jgi:predicted nucleic acid-binding protein
METVQIQLPSNVAQRITQEDYEAALNLFLLDVRNEKYVIGLLSDHAIQTAVDLTKRHPLRAYDAVHLAIAIGLNAALLAAESPPLTFVSSDKMLCEAAGKEGIVTDNPELH